MRRHCTAPGIFGIAKTDLVGPLASFQAIAFNKDEVRQLLRTINKAAKEAALADRSLDETFDMWWPRLEEKVEDISYTQRPTEPHRSERNLLEEAVSNTRTLLREFQAQRPRQIFAPNREIEAFARELLQREPALSQGRVLDVLTGKSE